MSNPWPTLFQRCGACSCEYPIVQGQGPANCDAMAIGERPGERENERLVPFCGASGTELDGCYLPLAGLSRPRVYVTNIVKCWAKGNRTPNKNEITECVRTNLVGEYRFLQPEVVILMGAKACSIAGIWLEGEHGIPRQVPDFLGTGITQWVVPMYHPAAALHSTWYMNPLLEDWERLGEWMGFKGPSRWVWPVDEYEGQEKYVVLGEPGWKDLVDESSYRAVDTENNSRGKLWSAQISFRPGTALFLPLWDRQGAAMLQDWLSIRDTPIYFHYQDHDLRMLEQAGFHIHGPIRDTMHLSYQSQLHSQKLKALGRQVCGVQMSSYDEVVMPAARTEVAEWLEAAIEESAALDVDERRWKQYKNGSGKWIGKVKDNPAKKDLRRILRNTTKEIEHDAKPYNPWKSWQNTVNKVVYDKDAAKAEVLLRVEDRLGKMPRPGLDRVWRKDKAQAIRYACADADVTGRVGEELWRRNLEIGKEVEERDKDA